MIALIKNRVQFTVCVCVCVSIQKIMLFIVRFSVHAVCMQRLVDVVFYISFTHTFQYFSSVEDYGFNFFLIYSISFRLPVAWFFGRCDDIVVVVVIFLLFYHRSFLLNFSSFDSWSLLSNSSFLLRNLLYVAQKHLATSAL